MFIGIQLFFSSRGGHAPLDTVIGRWLRLFSLVWFFSPVFDIKLKEFSRILAIIKLSRGNGSRLAGVSSRTLSLGWSGTWVKSLSIFLVPSFSCEFILFPHLWVDSEMKLIIQFQSGTMTSAVSFVSGGRSFGRKFYISIDSLFNQLSWGWFFWVSSGYQEKAIKWLIRKKKRKKNKVIPEWWW